ncbi:MAG: phosphoadenosine phosphosulfate reductase family protein [Actinobacteria bacterium]|nr:phosphoadenosine phosphosulfate reductase family protein [Actinomycetota bacterium]
MVPPVTLLGNDYALDRAIDSGPTQYPPSPVDRRFDLDLDALDAEFESHGDPVLMVKWLADTFAVDDLVIASAMEAPVLVDLVSKVIPGIQVVFLDTGYHFDETLRTADRVAERYPIRLTVTPAPPVGDDQYLTDPDGCCNRRKVVPFERIRADKAAWISGVRRSDSASRQTTRFVHRDRNGLVKLNPLIAEGYPSIGCWPCTQRPLDPDDPRSGRWANRAKTECGLHL